MIDKILNLFWNFGNQWLRYRYVDPIISLARSLVIVGAGLMAPSGVWWILVTLEIQPDFLPASFSMRFGPDQITFSGIGLCVSGVLLGIWGANRIRKKSSSCLIYLRGLPGMHDDPPTEDMPPRYRSGEIKHLNLDIQNESIESALRSIEMLGQMLNDKIMSMNLKAPATVFAGLAPVPILYAAGVRLSTRKNLAVMDFNRFDQKWHLLDERDDGERLDIIYPKGLIDKDIAFALPLTLRIVDSQIPDDLRDRTIWAYPNGDGPRTDAFCSCEKLKKMLSIIHNEIRNLRSRPGYENIETVHLFIGAQASTVFKLGTEYQPNAYPEIRVYHFQGGEGKYTWGISVKNGQFNILDN